MNTPSHYVVNIAVTSPLLGAQANTAIAIGAILPDLPIFIFYIIAKFVDKLPERQIWTTAYYRPFWQNLVAAGHSIPLATLAGILSFYCGWEPGAIASLSAIGHSLLDLPVHNDDAHRHFFPLSNYRFISPISYWDPQHHGKMVALVELLAVVALSPLVFALVTSLLSKGLAIAIAILYSVRYARFYLLQPKMKAN